MDINSLLSPSENPRASSLTPTSGTGSLSHSNSNLHSQSQSPFRHVPRTQSGTAGAVSSPLGRSVQPPSSIPAHVRSPAQQTPHSSPLISPVPTGTASAHLPRSSSTPTMETFADFNSSKPTLPSRESTDSQGSSSLLFPHLTSAGATSNPRASIDINMVETPKPVIRADYTDTSLPVESQQRLTVLAAYIQQTPSSYEAHREIIKILHQGFVDHIYPSSSPNAHGDPRTYDLLTELRQARENLDKLFAVGEEQWLDWLQDESILAQTADERVAVVDKCRRAVTEEYGSTRLWLTYGDWVSYCHKWALDSTGEKQGDVDTERLIGREVFDWNIVLDTWTEAVERTKHDMSRSHEVWNKYMAIRFGDVSQKLSSDDATTALELFETRLRIPHAEWQQTFQAFSNFVSANVPADQYEEIMASNLRDSANAKKIWNDRDTLEMALLEAQNAGDTTVEYQAFSTYIEWEREEENKPPTQRKGKGKRAQEVRNPYFDMVDALYKRAELRFPSVLAIWEEHIDYLIEKSKSDLLEVLARATKHCPWSGSLWKQYMLTSELADEPFDETEKIKHKATSTGLLDAAGIEEALVVHDAWCGYLLRRTKRPDAVEEDADVAEMGIRSSIEAVHSLASKLGIGSAFDPSFRLQRKHVEYLKSQRRLDNAGAQFNDAVADYGKYYKFWMRYYEFEMQKSMQIALIQRPGPDRLDTLSSAPFAVGVLKQGLQYRGLDYPEPLMEALLNHCEDYEDADELQSAIILVRKVQKDLTARRQREAPQATEVAAQKEQAEEEVANRTQEVANGLHIGKRKRDEESDEEEAKKRQRNGETAEQSVESIHPPAEELKRDREHASVLVQNIPPNLSETKIRQYFSSCGIVKQVKLLQDEEDSVIVEFEDADAASFALSRNGREFEGAELSIVLNTGSTLFVTNYPAAADESYIRDLFRPYGEIINVRFPSLQHNKRRRFCYVEFKRPSEAQAATELDNKDIDGLRLVAKISNPMVRQARAEKSSDGRTVFVGQLQFKATAEDVEKLFSKYGTIEQLRLPQDPKSHSRNRGIAFVTFANPEEAQAALAMHGKESQGRKLTVNVTSERDGRSTKSINGRSKSPSLHPETASHPASTEKIVDREAIEARRARTVVICDVPDIVNESRIEAVAERIGPVRKVILKTNHQGALIEFENVPDAGRAMIELDNLEINPGRHIRVATEKEMLQQKPEHKIDQFARPAPKAVTPASGPVRRPAQPGIRKKGGHLGQRSSFLHGLSEKQPASAEQDNGSGKKTNDDFRNMINQT
ncbi:uncharacterized protein A1O5_12727 [Cladophialophora psammophila CBS 110553]|uniref:U4/U6 snRNA-associated-splicing factor PRP24 n=1 Tax=Cladophialophora psammophila CBS 110553 TaxID=1182543 RepID=W9VVM4_9EURO|nr:uncharacterized protein A1O5_12727 [Cladophialophora psammophila CBS 110553]EXJ56271.1 hypothetical protein A1O5_12727 [Cladophialophora psammophila CBS 110553]